MTAQIQWICLGMCLLFSTVVSAEMPEKKSTPLGNALLSIPNKTLGGDQFWCDEFIHGRWRIQRNVFSNHYRLLDGVDVRRAFGTYEVCLAEFEKLRDSESIPELHPEMVVLLHGLGRSRDTMESLGKKLHEQGNFEIVNFTYPSTRGTVSEHADSLEKVLAHFKEAKKIHFVAHSLGNIVVRHWMNDQLVQRGKLDPRIGRFVMLGPPNQGASLAEQLRGNPVFGLFLGKSGRQLGEQWNTLDNKLCIPPCEFGILAGNQSVNPLIPGENDLCVAVEETKLPGACDFRVLPLNHSTLRTNGTVHSFTCHFLQHGCFESDAKRQPLAKSSP
jgi:pimeloyl-ACP methyl ester carboxylesterase